MTTSEIVLYILWAVLLVIIGSNGIFNLIKFFKKSKIEESEWKAQCNLLADLLEKGVEIPNEIIIAVLRAKLSTEKFASAIKDIKPKKRAK